MQIRVMSWNMAGAKLFDKLDSRPYDVASSYIKAYKYAWEKGIVGNLTVPPNPPKYPDIILLQECIGFVDTRDEPSGRWQSGEEILQQIFSGYTCFFFPALSSYKNPHPAKWEKYRKGSGQENYLPDEIEAQQGYGICVHNPNQLRKIWVKNAQQDDTIALKQDDYHLCFAAINTTTGLYLGDRDTEPRLVILGRMRVGTNSLEERYVNFLNVHLTTLKGERIGNLRLNRGGSNYRIQQLDLIMDNIISSYQEATTNRIPRTSNTRKDDVWILGGDFNSTPDSEEVSFVKRMGFIDGNPDKKLLDATDSKFGDKIGTKWSLADPDLPMTVLDYIFCGLERTTFATGEIRLTHSHRPFRPKFQDTSFETDHAVLFASFEF